MIFVNDATGQTVYHDPIWEQLTGQQTRQALGRGWLDRIHAEDRSLVEDTHCEAVSSASEYCIQYRLLTPVDEPRWVRVGAQASIGPPDRTFIGFLGSLVILPDAPPGTYRAYGRMCRDSVLHTGEAAASTLEGNFTETHSAGGEAPTGLPSLRQRIQSAIGLSRLARRHVGNDGAYRARVALDISLIELAKEIERLKTG